MNTVFALLLAVPAVLGQAALFNTTIHPNGNTAKCLDVEADKLADGTTVEV